MADLLVNNPNWQSFASGLEQDRGLAPGLLAGIMKNETAGGHPDIVGQTSSAGAQGAFQFVPDTAKQYNVNVHDSADSTRGAADYLGDLTKKYRDPLLAGAAYNWGPGNLDKAIQAAKGAGVPTDALSLANHGFLPKETSGYVVKLAANLPSAGRAQAEAPAAGVQPYPPELVNQVQGMVVQAMQQGASPVAIVQGLSKSPVGAMIQAMTAQGTSPEDIIAQVGGTPLKTFQAAQAKVSDQGFATNVWQGVKSAGHDLSVGAQQLGNTIAGHDAQLQELNKEEAAREADPMYQAQQGTVGSQVGNFGVKAIPYAAAALVPELGVPAMIGTQAAVGATMGALKPTTADGQRLGNIGTEAAFAGAGGAGGALLGKGVTSLAGKLLGSGTDGAEAAALAARAQAEGLPVNAASIAGPNSVWRNVAEGMPTNAGVKAFSDKADASIAGKVADGLGIPSYTGPIDTDMLNAARPVIKQALDDATNVSVTLPQTMKADLQTIVGGAKNPLTAGIATDSVVGQATKNLNAAIDAGAPVLGRQLQELASELKAVTQNQAASASERQVAGKLVEQVNKALTSGMSTDEAAAFQAANSQYAAMKAVEKMVSASGDTGVVTPRQMINAVKSGRFKSQFYAGEAPFQDLAGTASDLYGPAAGKGLGSLLAKAADAGGDHGLTAAIVHPSIGVPVYLAKKAGSALLGKLATSENPTLVRLLTGQHSIDPTTASYIAKALGNAGAVSTAQ